MNNFIRYLIITVLLIGTIGICVATPPKIRRMVYFDIKVLSFDKTSKHGLQLL